MMENKQKYLTENEVTQICQFIRAAAPPPTKFYGDRHNKKQKLLAQLSNLDRLCQQHNLQFMNDFLKYKCTAKESFIQGQILTVVEKGEKIHVIIVKGSIELKSICAFENQMDNSSVHESMQIITVEQNINNLNVINSCERCLVAFFSDAQLEKLVQKVQKREEERKNMRKILHGQSLLYKCSSKQIETILDNSTIIHLLKNQNLYTQGQESNGFYILLKGELALVMESAIQINSSFNQSDGDEEENRLNSSASKLASETKIFLKNDQRMMQNKKDRYSSPSGKKNSRAFKNLSPLRQLSKSGEQENQKQLNASLSQQIEEQNQNQISQENYLSSAMMGHYIKNLYPQKISLLTEGSLVGLEDLLLEKSTRSSTVLGQALLSELLFIQLEASILFEFLEEIKVKELQEIAKRQINIRNERQEFFQKNMNLEQDTHFPLLRGRKDQTQLISPNKEIPLQSQRSFNQSIIYQSMELTPEKKRAQLSKNTIFNTEIEREYKNGSLNMSFDLDQSRQQNKLINIENQNIQFNFQHMSPIQTKYHSFKRVDSTQSEINTTLIKKQQSQNTHQSSLQIDTFQLTGLQQNTYCNMNSHHKIKGKFLQIPKQKSPQLEYYQRQNSSCLEKKREPTFENVNNFIKKSQNLLIPQIPNNYKYFNIPNNQKRQLLNESLDFKLFNNESYKSRTRLSNSPLQKERQQSNNKSNSNSNQYKRSSSGFHQKRQQTRHGTQHISGFIDSVNNSQVIDNTEQNVKKSIYLKRQLLENAEICGNINENYEMIDVDDKMRMSKLIQSKNKIFKHEEQDYLHNTKYSKEDNVPSSLLILEKYMKSKLDYFKKTNAFCIEKIQSNLPCPTIQPLQVASSAAVKNNKRKLKMSRKNISNINNNSKLNSSLNEESFQFEQN